MRKLISGSIRIIVLAVLSSACSGNAKDEGVIPTLAQLPTVIQVSPSPESTTLAPTQNSSESLPSAPIPDVTSTNIFANLTTATSPFPPDNQPLLFSTLVVGTETTLKGHLTITQDNQVILSDDAGHTVKVIVDNFVAQLVNNQLVQITGPIDLDAGIWIIRATSTTALEAADKLPTIEFALPPNGSETPLPRPPGSS